MTAKRDHYKVLGVPRDSTQNSIRKAFRQRAKECHPDSVGAEGEQRFQELNEAHEVLSNPASRRCYDDELRSSERQRGKKPDAVPTVGSAPSWFRSSVLGSSRPWRSGELIRDVDDHAAPRWTRRSHSDVQVFELEVILTPLELLRGARLPLVLTGPHERRGVELFLPAGLREGQVIHARVEPPIVRAPVHLRLTIRTRQFL